MSVSKTVEPMHPEAVNGVNVFMEKSEPLLAKIRQEVFRIWPVSIRSLI